MIPNTIFFASMYTLLFLFREYIFPKRRYEWTMLSGLLSSWLCALFPITNVMCISVAIVLFVAIIEISKTTTSDGNETKKIETINNNDIIVNDIYKGVKGTVIKTSYTNESYLGSIVLDGNVMEIVIYCDEELEQGDKFIILGLYGTKFMVEKIK